MFLAKPGEYEPCGILTTGHLVLGITTIVAVLIALKHTINKKKIKQIIKKCTIFVWICEVIM